MYTLTERAAIVLLPILALLLVLACAASVTNTTAKVAYNASTSSLHVVSK